MAATVNDQSKVVASRDIRVFTVAWDSDNALPANTVPWGDEWGTVGSMPNPWVHKGYTIGGVHFRTTVERAEIRVDQELDPVLRIATGRDTRMSTNLAQFDMDSITEATGQGAVTTTAATTASAGNDDWNLDSDIDNQYFSIGFDVLNAGDDEALRFAGWKGLVLGAPQFDVVPATALQIPLELALLPDTSTTPGRIATIRDVIPML